MRKIKFRGKQLYGEWVYGNYAEMYFNFSYKHQNTLIKPYIILGDSTAIEVVHETVGQFTGLPDMSGVDIYEGDICWDEHHECNGVVIFDEGKFKFVWENIINDLCEVHGEIEVIGNIHDNPELMEVEI